MKLLTKLVEFFVVSYSKQGNGLASTTSILLLIFLTPVY